jgi:release factor glutamine methyltransferase
MSPEQPWTVSRLLKWTNEFLARKGAESASLDAALLLAHALGCKRLDLYTRYEETAPDDARQRYRELVQQRVAGCPTAYLLGRKEFFSLEFEVNRAVLIPRPDTEWLVTEFLRLARGKEGPRVLDVGTGSGCLAVAAAVRHRSAQVTATDVSADALAVAARNAARHNVAERIRFLQGDLFGPLAADERFDFILSNPPYVPTAEIERLAPAVRDYEPRLALDGGPDGLAVFDRLITEARTHLEPGGSLLIEIGWDQEVAVRGRLEAVQGYELEATVHDAAGHPRVLRATRTAD